MNPENIELQISFMSILAVLGAVHGLLIAFFLLKKQSGNKTAHLFLALILTGFSLQIYDHFMFATNWAFQHPHLSFLGYPFTMAYAPLLYLFVVSIINQKPSFSIYELIHFLPATLHLIYGLVTYHFNTTTFKIEYITIYKSTISALYQGNGFSYTFLSFQLFVSIHLATYIFLAFKKITRYKRNNSQEHNNHIYKRIKWIRLVMISVIFTWVLVTTNIIHLTTGLFLSQEIGYLTLIILTGYIYYLSYFILNNPEIFDSKSDVPVKKYQSSSLGEAEKNELLKKLSTFMKNEKPFLNHEITIAELATSLNIQSKHLSQIINEHFNQNFYEFINQHRIEEAKKLLVDPSYNHFSILGIGIEVGFKSKSSFNTAFKKFASTTPSQFKATAQSTSSN